MRSAVANRYYGALFRYWLIFHTTVLEHVSPLATGAGVAVFQVLAEVVCAEELLRLVALAELVDVVEVLGASLPARGIGEFFATIAADIRATTGHGLVEGGLRACEGGARPGMVTQMKRVLVTLSFVLVLEPVRAVSAAILFLRLVHSVYD